MSKDKVMELLRKLVAKEESTREIGNLAEAEAFAQKIGELLQKHKLEMSDVELAAQDAEDPMGEDRFDPASHGVKARKARIAWLEQLASVVAKAHFCRIMVVQRSNRVVFVGRESDRAVAAAMYGILARTAEKLSARDYNTFFQKMKRHGTPEKARGFTNAWLNGYVNAIRERYHKLREEVHTERGMALVKRADQDVLDYLNSLDTRRVKSATGLATRANGTGYNKGQNAGKSVSLQGGIAARETASQRLFKRGYDTLSTDELVRVWQEVLKQDPSALKEAGNAVGQRMFNRPTEELTDEEVRAVANALAANRTLAAGGAK